MTARVFISMLVTSVLFSPSPAQCQNIEKIFFDAGDSTAGYYLAVPPKSGMIKGVVVLLTSFTSPEDLLPETKLHNVASANDLLTVIAFMKQKLYADSFATNRINTILRNVVTRFAADTSSFVLAGYDEAGNIALRYTELTYEHPDRFLVQPKAVFAVDTPVDLFGWWHWSERQIKKNYWPGAVGDARFYLDAMTKENGTLYTNPQAYKRLTPFDRASDTTGNEQYLKSLPVRLYYDSDINWQLKNRRNSFYDTKMPDASELINRLLLLGNGEAEFVTSRQPGMRSNGLRHPNALSIVDEVDCIHWIKRSLHIFDANTWVPPYGLAIPRDWTVERFSLPPDFAPGVKYNGVEDLSFAPGWGDVASEGYWSYTYLWWLYGNRAIDAGSLSTALAAYYRGLVARNIVERKIPADKVVPTIVTIKKITTVAGDRETFSGTIQMLDYMAQRPLLLNTVIHLKDCGLQKHTAVLVAVSPKPAKHPVWQQLGNISNEFQCGR